MDFGKYEGKTLPQILFSDPDWFFWAIEKNALSRNPFLRREGQEIDSKVRAIRIPKADYIAHYLFDRAGGKISDLELIPRDRPTPSSWTLTEVIDLSLPRQFAKYDKTGYKNLMRSLKYILFGDEKCALTKELCEDFFSNDAMFDVT